MEKHPVPERERERDTQTERQRDTDRLTDRASRSSRRLSGLLTWCVGTIPRAGRQRRFMRPVYAVLIIFLQKQRPPRGRVTAFKGFVLKKGCTVGKNNDSLKINGNLTLGYLLIPESRFLHM